MVFCDPDRRTQPPNKNQQQAARRRRIKGNTTMTATKKHWRNTWPEADCGGRSLDDLPPWNTPLGRQSTSRNRFIRRRTPEGWITSAASRRSALYRASKRPCTPVVPGPSVICGVLHGEGNRTPFTRAHSSQGAARCLGSFDLPPTAAMTVITRRVEGDVGRRALRSTASRT